MVVWRDVSVGREVLVFHEGVVEVAEGGLEIVLAWKGADSPSGRTWYASCDGIRILGSSSGYGNGGLVAGRTGEGD